MNSVPDRSATEADEDERRSRFGVKVDDSDLFGQADKVKIVSQMISKC
jgi:hypothetical protein